MFWCFKISSLWSTSFILKLHHSTVQIALQAATVMYSVNYLKYYLYVKSEKYCYFITNIQSKSKKSSSKINKVKGRSFLGLLVMQYFYFITSQLQPSPLTTPPNLPHRRLSPHVPPLVSCRGTTPRLWPAWRPACRSWPEPCPPPDWTWSAPSPGTWCATSCTGRRPWAGWSARSGGSTRGRRRGPAPETQRWFTTDSVSCSSQVCAARRRWRTITLH